MFCHRFCELVDLKRREHQREVVEFLECDDLKYALRILLRWEDPEKLRRSSRIWIEDLGFRISTYRKGIEFGEAAVSFLYSSTYVLL